MRKDDAITRKMFSLIRENTTNKPKTKGMLLTEEEEKNKNIVITKSTPQFGDVRVNQESDLVKTIGERVELEDNALTYYSENKDLILIGKISSLGVKFQFRYNDPSGVGCYIWADSLQLTDTNTKTLGKIKAAFDIWKQKLDEDGDLMEKLHKAAISQR